MTYTRNSYKWEWLDALFIFTRDWLKTRDKYRQVQVFTANRIRWWPGNRPKRQVCRYIRKLSTLLTSVHEGLTNSYLSQIHISQHSHKQHNSFQPLLLYYWKYENASESSTGSHSKHTNTGPVNDQLMRMLSDEMLPKYTFHKTFKISILDRQVWEIVCYSDSSKTTEGAGASICCAKPKSRMSINLTKHATLFQTEIAAIYHCAK